VLKKNKKRIIEMVKQFKTFLNVSSLTHQQELTEKPEVAVRSFKPNSSCKIVIS